ncbi:MAG: hypothetical protein KGJ88_03770 [Verrucomicrobiota bacterium]|nr:hypothetical protein [Verrucomicrobiota bacterium]
MKTILTCLMAAAFALAAAGAPAPRGKAPSKAVVMPESVFVMPRTPAQGRDPFFPDSMRPYEAEAKPSATVREVERSDLVVRSIVNSKTPLTIINDVTFGAGDAAVVTTPNGQKVEIRCLAIDPRRRTVLVTANGQRMVLVFSSKP